VAKQGGEEFIHSTLKAVSGEPVTVMLEGMEKTGEKIQSRKELKESALVEQWGGLECFTERVRKGR